MSIRIRFGYHLIPRQTKKATHSGDGQRELRHGMKGVRTSVNELFDEFRDLRSSCPFLRKTFNLFIGRYFSS